MKFILGKKLNMSQMFTVDGGKVPVTALEVGPCKVIQVKKVSGNGYDAVQIGFGVKKRLNRAAAGHQKAEKFSYLREFRVPTDSDYKMGQLVSVSDFKPGEYADVSGVMKGRGFAGAMKRHGFHGMPASHGHNRPRSVGSIGSRFPQHTLKGTRMAGRMGGHWVTVKNLMIVDIDEDKNVIWVSGAVPGTRGGLIRLITTGKIATTPPALYEIVKENPPEVAAKISQAKGEKSEDIGATTQIKPSETAVDGKQEEAIKQNS